MGWREGSSREKIDFGWFRLLVGWTRLPLPDTIGAGQTLIKIDQQILIGWCERSVSRGVNSIERDHATSFSLLDVVVDPGGTGLGS